MATSAPTPPADPAAAPPVEHQQVLDTIAAQTAAIDDLIGRARHSIRVFDYDLSETGWNGKTRAENLATFLRTNRNARLDIIVHDTRWLERSCPRMTNLLKLFSHVITIYRTGPGAKGAMDPLIDRRWPAFPASLPHRAAARDARNRRAACDEPAGQAFRGNLGDRRTRHHGDRARTLMPAPGRKPESRC